MMRRCLPSLFIALLVATPAAWSWQLLSTEKPSFGVAVVGLAGGGAIVTGTGRVSDDVFADPYGFVLRRDANGRIRWRVELAPNTYTDGVRAIGASGVVVGLGGSGGGVARFDVGTGQMVWRWMAGTPSSIEASRSMIVAPSGAVFVNTIGPEAITKLDGATGAQLWRHDFSYDGTCDPGPFYVDIDGDENVLVGGRDDIAGACGRVTRKLAAADGAVLWTNLDPTPSNDVGYVHDVAVDGAGDVYLSRPCTVVKLSGDTGVELWTAVEPAGCSVVIERTQAIEAVDGDDVIVGFVDAPEQDAGTTSLARLDGATGDVTWSATGEVRLHRASNMVADAEGGLWISGLRGQEVGSGSDFAVERRDATSGAALGTQVVRSPGDQQDAAADRGLVRSLDVLSGGLVSAAGDLRLSQLGAVQFSSALLGTKLTVTDDGSTPSRRKLALKLKDPLVLAPATRHAADPTVLGLTVRVRNPNTLEEAIVALPAAGWTALPGARGGFEYRYGDKTGALGPCRAARIQSGKGLSLTCGGAALPLALDEPQQGALRIDASIGSHGPWYCVEFGAGTVVKDVGGGTGVRSFVARNAPRPAQCPG